MLSCENYSFALERNQNLLWILPLFLLYVCALAGCNDVSTAPTPPAGPGPLTITSTSLPDGTVNLPYAATLGATGGVTPYSWSVSPALPSGLSLDQKSGTITGTPTVEGTTSHTLTLSDSSSPQQTVQKTLSLTINPAAAVLSITTTSLPDGAVGQSYNQTLHTSGGSGTLTWSLDSGTLPQNLTLNPATGVISGTPSASGTSSFTVRVTDTVGQADTQGLSILIAAPSPPTITTASPLPGGTVGQAYSQTLQATGGTGTLVWSLVSGSLPTNLTISASGIISGTPTNAGTSNFTVKVTDALSQSATKAFSITISAPSPPTITTLSPLPGGTVGQPYSQTLQATGGTGTLVWTLAGGSLPANLTLSSGGTISGTPTNAGTSNFTVRVTDSLSQSATKAFSLTIAAAPPPLTITTNSPLPNARVGKSYSETLQRSGGVSPFTWSVSPALPTGLNLNPSSGAITGTPASGTARTYLLTFTVQDSSTPKQSASKLLSLTVTP